RPAGRVWAFFESNRNGGHDRTRPRQSTVEELTAVKTRIVRVGNSQGIRIPRALLEQAGLSGEVELCVRAGALVIRRARKPRAGWAAAFQAMAERGDDALDEGAALPTPWEEDEWEWG